MKLCGKGLHDLDDPKVAYVDPSTSRRKCRLCTRTREQTPEAKAKKLARNQKPEAKALEHIRHQKPEYKAKLRALQQTPEYKAREHARRTPEWKAKQRERDRHRRQRPEVKAKRRAQAQTPEYKAKAKVRNQKPEYKAKAKVRNQKPEAKAKARARSQTPAAKARRQTPEARAKAVVVARAYRQRPEVRARELARSRLPETKAKAKAGTPTYGKDDMSRTTKTKYCARCRKPKLLSEFNRSRADCRPCHNARARRFTFATKKRQWLRCHKMARTKSTSHSPATCIDDATADQLGQPRCPCSGDRERCEELFGEAALAPTPARTRTPTPARTRTPTRARARKQQALLTPHTGTGTRTPPKRGTPVGNSGSTAEQLMHRLLRRAGWRVEWYTRYQRYGFDAICRRGRKEVLYLEIKSGGSIEMTDWEWHAAEKYGPEYRLVHVYGGHVRYYIDPAHDPLLRHRVRIRHTITGWRDAGTADPAWLEPIRSAARTR